MKEIKGKEPGKCPYCGTSYKHGSSEMFKNGNVKLTCGNCRKSIKVVPKS